MDHLDKKEREIALEMLADEIDVFSKSKKDIGYIKDFKLKIDLVDGVPVSEAYRKIPKHLYVEMKNHIINLLANDWIKQSHSASSSPMVCVRKKDGVGLRLCIYFRKLNRKTIPDKQPIPRIRIPYGITNAPPGFQRFINNCLYSLRGKICISYLDDILVYRKTFEGQIESLKKVLRCLRRKGVSWMLGSATCLKGKDGI